MRDQRDESLVLSTSGTVSFVLRNPPREEDRHRVALNLISVPFVCAVCLSVHFSFFKNFKVACTAHPSPPRRDQTAHLFGASRRKINATPVAVGIP